MFRWNSTAPLLLIYRDDMIYPYSLLSLLWIYIYISCTKFKNIQIKKMGELGFKMSVQHQNGWDGKSRFARLFHSAQFTPYPPKYYGIWNKLKKWWKIITERNTV